MTLLAALPKSRTDNLKGRGATLTIDTEGHDLEVLRRAQPLLRRGAIDIAQAEVSMNPENTLHVSFSAVREFLEQFEYRLFGLYEQ